MEYFCEIKLIFNVFVVIAGLCNVLLAKECVTVDQCKCTFDDGSGTVDISPLGKQDGSALIQDQFAPDNYAYSYNPCYPFIEGTCVNAAACQFDSANVVYYEIGDASSASFWFDGSNVNVNYTTGIRSTKVVLICDPSAKLPHFEVKGEVATTVYGFSVTSKHACPNKPIPTKKTCQKIDECKCRFSDGSGTVDLSTIGRQDGTPQFQDVFAPDGNSYSYNPCYPFTEDKCDDVALCQYETNHSTYYKIGDVKSNEFFYDGINLFSRYTSTTQGITRTSLITFVCDTKANQPTMRALGEVFDAEYIFTVTSSAACPKPPPVCTKVDNCRCTMSDGTGTVDISTLGKQGGVPLIKDVFGPNKMYTFSFNPCYPFSEGSCTNVSACLQDPNTGLYYDIGEPTVTFENDGENIIGIYKDYNNFRTSRVTYVCSNSTSQTSAEVLGEISPSVYGFKVTSQDVCPKRDDN